MQFENPEAPLVGIYRIPFNKPFIVGKELFYISQAVMSGQLAGDGKFTLQCQKLMEDKFGAEKVLLTHSCTAALEMAAMLCDLQSGDEVIMPSYTFVSSANSLVLRGAVPVFVDIRRDNLNIDESLIEAAITPRTKAIMVVHYAGVGCEMDEILAIAKKHGLRVIEDAAHGLNATYHGKYLGTLGDLGTFSYHETKNCISGEGGALVINDRELVDRAEILREKGTDRARFFRGEVDKYTWVDTGSSYLPSEVIAAFLYAQLEMMDEIDARRVAIYDRYAAGLRPVVESGRIEIASPPEDRVHNAHMFYVLCESSEERGRFAKFLKDRSINAVHHYVPLHSSPNGVEVCRTGSPMTVTDDLSARLLRLPVFYELRREDQQKVIDATLEFFA